MQALAWPNSGMSIMKASCQQLAVQDVMATPWCTLIKTKVRPQGANLTLSNKYPPAEPEVLRLLAPRRGLTAIEKSKSKTERPTNCIIPELSNCGSPPAEPGVYLD